MAEFREMDDAALLAEFMQWDHKVKTATGWGAALMQAAKWRDACGRILAERGLMQDFEPCIGKQETVAEEIARLQSEIARLEGRMRFLVLGDPRIRVEVPTAPPSPQGQTKKGGR